MVGRWWKRIATVALVVASGGTTARLVHAEPAAAPATAPAYTLVVDSDDVDVLSYEALAARLQRELGSPVTRADGPMPSRAAITVRYRKTDRALTVRASHAEGRVLERTVEVGGDAAETQATTVLLAGNLARDEARELLDALSAKKARASDTTAEEEPTPSPPSPPEGRARDDGWMPVNLALAWPVAMNYGRPDVRTNVDVSLLYSRVGSVEGVALATGVSHTSGDLTGVQLGGVGNVVLQDLQGVQIAAGLNLVRGTARGLQLAPLNVAQDLRGAQIVGGVNVARDVRGLQLGVVNVGRRVRGAQVALVNVAEEVDGAQIGLLSISRHGIHPVVWGSTLNYLNVGLRFSTKYVYTTTAFSLGTHEGTFASPGVTAGLGAHLPLVMKLDLDLETAFSTMFGYEGRSSGTQNSAVHLRGLVGWSFATRFRVFAGGGARLATAFDVGRPKARPEFVAGVSF